MRRLKYPGTTGVIIRKTYPELHGNHIEKFWVEYPELRQFYNAQNKMIRLPNGSIIYFRHLKSKDDIYNYQGTEYDDILIDEATQHTEQVFKILRSSNRTVNPGIKPRFFLTGNPGGIGHAWVKRLFIDKEYEDDEKPEDYGFVQANVYDNDVLMNADPNYVSVLESLPEDEKKMYLYGDWDVLAGQFFAKWRKDKHVVEPLFAFRDAPENWTYRLGLDDGTRAPRAMVLVAQDNDGCVHVMWEYYATGETTSVAATNIKTKLERNGLLPLLQRQARIIYDPSMDIKNNQTGQSSISDFTSILGIPGLKADNSRIEGGRVMQNYIDWTPYQDPLFKVWGLTCPNVAKTFPNLIYDGNNREDIDTEGEDHLYDAVRYAVMSLPKKPQRFKSEKPLNAITNYTKRRNIWGV